MFLLQSPPHFAIRSPVQFCLVPPLGCIYIKRVESSPIQSSQTHKDVAVTVAYLQLLTRQCVHTSRVESSPTSLAESRVLMPHVFFFVSQTPVIGCDGKNGRREVHSFR